jgi:hypothetical protein
LTQRSSAGTSDEGVFTANGPHQAELNDRAVDANLQASSMLPNLMTAAVADVFGNVEGQLPVPASPSARDRHFLVH